MFGCNGEVSNDVLIAAYSTAYEAGSDIITALHRWPRQGGARIAWAVAVARIVEQGVPCTVSAGNEGTEGLFYSSTSADGKRVTAVASVDNIMAPALWPTPATR